MDGIAAPEYSGHLFAWRSRPSNRHHARSGECASCSCNGHPLGRKRRGHGRYFSQICPRGSRPSAWSRWWKRRCQRHRIHRSANCASARVGQFVVRERYRHPLYLLHRSYAEFVLGGAGRHSRWAAVEAARQALLIRSWMVWRLPASLRLIREKIMSIPATRPRPDCERAGRALWRCCRRCRRRSKRRHATNLNTPFLQGKLTYTSPTALLSLSSRRWRSLVRVNGVVYRIPATGIAGLANTAGCAWYVGGVAGQNLAASTVYMVTCFISAGVLTAHFSVSITHTMSSTAGNVGTEIFTGNDNHTLIGMIRTNASSQFVDSPTQRFVRSWAFDNGIDGSNFFTANQTTTSSVVVELNSGFRGEVLLWALERLAVSATATISQVQRISRTQRSIVVGIDNVVQPMGGLNILANAGDFAGAAAQAYSASLVEGYHYVQIMGGVNTGTTTFYGDNDGRKTGIIFRTQR